MKKPLISVVIPAFNEEKYLPKCLEAVTSQNFPKDEYEVIVVDNNSTDKTAEIAKSFGARVIKEPQQGNTYAIATGMNAAKGEVIAMTDADTVVASDWLLNIKKLFEDPKIVGATGTADIITKSEFLDLLSEAFYELFIKFNFLVGKPHLTGFNLIVRRKEFTKIGGINKKFTMSPDVDLGLRLKKHGKVVFSNKIKAVTSFRRWQEDPFKPLYLYLSGYIYAVWLRRPPPVKQEAVR